MTTIIIIALVVILGWYFVSTQRDLVSKDELCKNAMSQISVQLNSRWDAILALAKMAAQYSKHESETIIKAVEARRVNNVTTAREAEAQQGEINNLWSRLMAVAESYPDLKAADLFKDAMGGVKQYEENVRMARQVYNDTATKMNRIVRQFPSSIVASVLHFNVQEYLKIDDEKKSQYPDLDEAFKK